MSRTTIMADDALLDQLRAIADEEGISLGEVIRQGLEWRASTRRRVPSFIGKLPGPATAGPSPSIGLSDEERDIAKYVATKHARIRAEGEAASGSSPRAR